MVDATDATQPSPAVSGPSRRRLALAGGAAALLGLAAGWSLNRWREPDAESDAEGKFWGQKLLLTDGRMIETKTLRGQPLLVNFWATWCPPCIEEMPLIDAFYLENKSKRHQVLGIALDKQDAVEAFLRRVTIHYPLAMGPSEGITLSRDLGNLSGGLPFTVFFAGSGRVARRKMGKLLAQDLQAWSQIEA